MQITKQDLKQIKMWIAALRSGKYKQTIGRLEDKSGFCCLGVACKVLVPTEKQKMNEHGYLEGGTTMAQHAAPAWLRKVGSVCGESLIDLNDCKGATFDEIADLLELYFVYNAEGSITYV